MMQSHFQNPRIEFTRNLAVIDNILEITVEDKRFLRQTNVEVALYSNRDVKSGLWNDEARRNPHFIRDNIGLQQTYAMRTIAEVYYYPTYLCDCY